MKVSAVQFMFLSGDNIHGAGLLIEQLRYAGKLSVVRENVVETGTWYVLQIRPPHGYNDVRWAQQNVERMQSFGINAEIVRVDK